MLAALFCAMGIGRIWQIGAPDGTGAGFGLAPDRYRLYREDPVFIVGRSAESDWPYVLPGPDDSWAGSREHRDSVVFGLKGAGACRFTCNFVETHYEAPPKLTLWVNGKRIAAWQSPKGNGDPAIEGHPEKGRHSTWSTLIPAKDLTNGTNELQIRNERGSWAAFDSLRLEGEGATIPVAPGFRATLLGQDQAVLRTPQGPRQRIKVEITNFGPSGNLNIAGAATWSGAIGAGAHVIELLVPAVQTPKDEQLIMSLGRVIRVQKIRIEPVRKWTVYLLPHSHVDIGYTDLQPVVAAMHRRNLFDAMSVAKESAGFPADSRYRFNMEATWVLDNLLQDGTPEERREVAQGFKNGTIDSSANYCNVLTGLMRPEELMRSYGYSTRLRSWLGTRLTTASQTDVPGVTWGAVAAMSQAGIRNLVLMPNPADRIGGVLSSWQDKPFFWVSPSGKEKVLVWETASYGVAHGLRHFNGDRTKIFRTADPTKNFIEGYVFKRLDELAKQNFPYDCIAFPWSGTDNFPVDADVPYAVRHWNETYVTPHVVSTTFTEACEELRKKYGANLPVVKGDFTPYWEDGAGSSARETAMNRASADRMVQAETLKAMTNPEFYQPGAFWRAWSNVILYSEHTWGAFNSISEPDSEFVKGQWKIKQGFAIQADESSRQLLTEAPGENADQFSVVNTTSWPRTDLVELSASQSRAGDRVEDYLGHPMPSQRLASGRLAVLVRNVPPFGSHDLVVRSGRAFRDKVATANAGGLSSPEWQIRLDPATSRITSLWSKSLKRDFAKAPYDINRYYYLPGSDLRKLQGSKALRCEVVDAGPLVASVRITSAAEGARKLTQEIRLVAGLDRVDFDNEVDKIAVRAKEGVHFAFPFAVPNGQIRIQGPWAVIRPDLDQIPGSNKNWFTTQYFADVSNAAYGLTWSSLDAPLMEVGGVTANMLDGGYDPKQWIQHLGPTQTLYSWAMNNHWYTNYRADQEGRLTFRYSLRAHGRYDPADAYRFGAGLAQPLLVWWVFQKPSLLRISDPSVVASALKPSEDGKALILRLWCVGDKPARPRLLWRPGVVVRSWLSDSSEQPLRPIGDTIGMAGWQVVTVRAELRADLALGR